MNKIKLIMIMAMQRSGTSALFETLTTAPTLVGYEESLASAIYDDYYLRPEPDIRAVLRSSRARVLLKPVRETERRTLVSIINEYADYELSILWLYRDPVNVLFSYGEMGWLDANTVEFAALEWVARNRMVIELPRVYHHKVTLLRYEELVSDPSVLQALNRKLGIRARSTFRHDSNAGRSRMPIATQAQIDAITSITVHDLDRLRILWHETGRVSRWKRIFGQHSAGVSRQVRPTSDRSCHLEGREATNASTVIDFNSEQFQREPHDCLRRWRECRRHHYAESANVWSLSGYDEVSDALKDSERFVYQAERLQGASPEPEEEQLRDAIAGAILPESAELAASRLEGLASHLITQHVAEGHFELVNVCRVTVAAMFYQMLGVSSDDPDGFFERTIRGDSVDDLSRGFSNGGWLSRVAAHPSLSSGELQRFLQFGSYYHYVTAIFASSAVHFLLGQPGLVEEIRRDPDQFASTFTELVRLAFPLLVVERWTRVEVEVAGCKIPAHNLIYLAIGASNRDPAAFARPDEFLMGRDSLATSRPLTGYANAAFRCSYWEELGHLVGQTLLKVLLLRLPVLEPVNPLGESKFTVKQSCGDIRECLHIPFLRYLNHFEVKFQSN